MAEVARGKAQARNADVVLVPGAAVTSAQTLAKSLHHFAPQM